MYFDDKLTKSLQDWLNTPPAQRDFAFGAEMMLKLNNNRILYHNAMRRPDKMMEKVEYELRKFLKMRLDRMTSNMVVVMDRELMPKVKATLADNAPVIDADDDNSLPPKFAKGKRDDHDSLPPEIQSLWDNNGDIYFKIKELYNTLKAMDKAEPCDRYEYLVQLRDLDIAYHERLAAYDAFVLHPSPISADGKRGDDAADMFRKAAAARTYITENKNKLQNLVAKREEFKNDSMSLADIDKEYDKILAKVQKRYDWLVEHGLTVSAEQLAALRDLGLMVVTNDD